LVGPTGF